MSSVAPTPPDSHDQPDPRCPACLSRKDLRRAVAELSGRDPDLGAVVQRLGQPPLWARRPGFSTLVQIVLEQQVSLASARAALGRLRAAIGRITPQRVAALSEDELRSHGLTRQKARYCRDLAGLVISGKLDLQQIANADDGTARQALLAVRGIGPWTADVYLLMALLRPDVWPDGDLALIATVGGLKRLQPSAAAIRVRRIAAAWRPWRSVAARILWHHYLSPPTSPDPS